MNIFKLTALVFVALLSKPNWSQKAESPKKYQSLLWEISKPGKEGKSYLYGTMHVSSKVAFHLTDSFYVAIKGVDVVGLETNPEYWIEDMLKSDAYSKYLYKGFNNSSKGFYSRSFRMEPLETDDIRRFLSVDSRFANNLLYRKSMGYQNNFQEDTYLDMFIFQSGKKLGKVVTNLEDFEESQKLVTKSQMADMKNRNYGYRNRYDFDGKNPYEIIEDAYRNGDLDLLDSIGRITGTEEGREFMLYLRNENIANSMDSIISGGQKLFAAVGAAHLPGDRGVIEEMRKKGYSVRPVYGAKSRDEKQKEEIDKLVHPFKLKKEIAEDGRFSAYLPAKMINTPEAPKLKEIQVPDMANGGIYFLRQANTFAPLKNQSMDDQKNLIDSLLYENIPGKIIEIDRDQKDEYGHPIILLKNKTKQGDIQQYKIIITPFELYIFKVSGIKTYADREDVQLFIDSARVHCDYDKDWRKVSPYFEGFEVELPGDVKIQDARKFTTLNKNALIQAYDQNSKNYYALIQNTLNDFDYIEEDTFELRYLAERFSEQLDFEEFRDAKFSTTDGQPSYTHTAINKEGKTLQIKTIINGPHYYLLLTNASKKDRKKFFESFTFTDFIAQEKVNEIEDTLLLYTVSTTAKDPRSEYDNLYKYSYYDQDLVDSDYEEMSSEITYFFQSTGEEIRVSFEKWHDFYSMDEDEAYESWNYAFDFIEPDKKWNPKRRGFPSDIPYNDYQLNYGSNNFMTSLKYMIDEDFNYHLSQDRFIENHPSGLRWKEYKAVHKNSTRAIYGRYLFYKGRSYDLRVSIDSAKGPSKEVLQFMDNFIPSDTLIGQPLGQSKDSLFFAYLASGDSLLETRAIESIYMVDFSETEPQKMINLMDTLNFERFEKGFTVRTDFIKACGEIDDPKILKYLEKKYFEAEDTSSLQIAILGAIRKNRTKENTELFMKLLLKETPLTSKYKINSMFFSYTDSLELNQYFYPDFYALAGVPEYTDLVYGRLVGLLDSGIISKDFYASKLDDIYRETKMEIIRFNNQTIDDQNGVYGYDIGYDYYDYPEVDYKFNKGVASVYGFSNIKLANQLKLLVPFYEEERIKKLFDKMLKIDDLGAYAFTTGLLKKIGIKNEIENWRKIKDEKKTESFTIYHILKDLEEEKMIKELGYSDDSIAYAALTQRLKLDEEEKDSLEFKKLLKLEYKNQPFHIYVYKYKKHIDKKYAYAKSKNEWALAMVGIMPENEEKKILPGLIEIGITVKVNETEEEVIQEKLKTLRFLERERVSLNDRDYGYMYDY